jgi:hypothetical protein
MDVNNIITDGFSNPETRFEYHRKIERHNHIEFQCGGCSFFAVFNADYGLCCYDKSRFYLETVFEHFGCEKHVDEGWSTHSFQEEKRLHLNVDNLLSLLLKCEQAFSDKRSFMTKNTKRLWLQIGQFLSEYKPSGNRVP